MAHHCPVCLCRCTCNGDIDDIIMPDDHAENTYAHCMGEPDIFTDEDAEAEIESDIIREATK